MLAFRSRCLRDLNTTAEEMFAQGQEMFSWIPNAYVKYPCTREGLRAAEMSVQIGTVASKVLREWATAGFPMPDQDFVYKGVDAKGKTLKPIPYKDLDLNLPWENFDLAHELTTKGIQKFVADYQSTLRRSA
jgi:transaldolase